MTGYLEAISAWLGGVLGDVLGKIAALVIFLLVAFALWGLPWLQIISRSGFKRRARLWLFGLMFAPLVIVSGLSSIQAHPALLSTLSGVAGLFLYLGLWLVALLPVKPKKSTSAAPGD